MTLNSPSNIQQPVLGNIINLEPLSQQKHNQEKHGQTSTDHNYGKGKNYEEKVFDDLVDRGYTKITKGCGNRETKPHPTVLRDSEGSRLCSCDFVAERDGIIEYIEAKGGVTGRVNSQRKQTSGARRSVSVKLALYNGVLFKKRVPNSRYIVYFSQEPAPKSPSDIAIKDALKDNIVDEVRYLHFYETTD